MGRQAARIGGLKRVFETISFMWEKILKTNVTGIIESM